MPLVRTQTRSPRQAGCRQAGRQVGRQAGRQAGRSFFPILTSNNFTTSSRQQHALTPNSKREAIKRSSDRNCSSTALFSMRCTCLHPEIALVIKPLKSKPSAYTTAPQAFVYSEVITMLLRCCVLLHTHTRELRTELRNSEPEH